LSGAQTALRQQNAKALGKVTREALCVLKRFDYLFGRFSSKRRVE
jgi:hypothetical protein